MIEMMLRIYKMLGVSRRIARGSDVSDPTRRRKGAKKDERRSGDFEEYSPFKKRRKTQEVDTESVYSSPRRRLGPFGIQTSLPFKDQAIPASAGMTIGVFRATPREGKQGVKAAAMTETYHEYRPVGAFIPFAYVIDSTRS